jgi:UDP-N-acetylmuramoylalanine--D-glutamate ligase
LALSFDWLQERLRLNQKNHHEVQSNQHQTQLVGVTGSIGKSTVSALVAHGLESIGLSIFLGGNFGEPLATHLLEHIKGNDLASIIVLELSSYNLENCGDLSFTVSALTNFSENHLDRYDSKEDYYFTKLSIVERTRQVAFYNPFSPDLKLFIEKHWSQLREKILLTEIGFGAEPPTPMEQNKALAKAVCFELVEDELKKNGIELAIENFKGLKHRYQFIRSMEKNSRTLDFINDSKATNIESVFGALAQSIKYDFILWLVGGRDKNHSWELLSAMPISAAKIEIIFFGESARKMRELSGMDGKVFGSLRETLKHLEETIDEKFFNSENGYAKNLILLSPGGSSLDEFGSFEERGDFFSQWARQH